MKVDAVEFLSKKMTAYFEVEGEKNQIKVSLQNLKSDATADQAVAVADALASVHKGAFADLQIIDTNRVFTAEDESAE